MVLNYVWIGFFLIGFVVAVIRAFLGNLAVMDGMMQSTFDMAATGFTIAIGLTGVLTLWTGIMRIGENGGVIAAFARLMDPVFRHIFPDIPKGHPASGSIMMNFSANMLGLDNAATPLGIKAMEQLQELNVKKDTASNAQIMFIVLNTSGLTLIPVSIMALRATTMQKHGIEGNPSDVFLPILLATFFSTLVALFVTSIYQRINLFKPAILLFFLIVISFLTIIITTLMKLTPGDLDIYSRFFASFTLFAIIISFILLAMGKKINVYESFIEGAKEGFQTSVKIIPYLVAMLVAIGVFRASGAMDYLVLGIERIVSLFTNETEFVQALPTGIMRPLSGGGSRALMIESWGPNGEHVNSLVGRMTSTIQGSTETTFYTLAVYFGAVNVRHTRHTLPCALIADFTGITSAIILCYIFFG
jgi:spore maturation protein SpmA